MDPRISKIGGRILVLLVATTVLWPVAQAASKSSEGTGSCTGNACLVVVRQFVESTAADCVGSPGAYDGCWVNHWCSADIQGPVVTASLDCYAHDGGVRYPGGGSGACSTLTSPTFACSAQAFDRTFLLAGQCGWFRSDVQAWSPLGAGVVHAPAVRMCVSSTGSGPF